MSYSYLPTTNAYRPARRQSTPPSLVKSVHDALPPWATQGVYSAVRTAKSQLNLYKSKDELKRLGLRTIQTLFTVTNGLIVLWICTLWWGERSVFRDSVDACTWNAWEKWPTNARPHHVAFIADPQLVDPHTYPDRPWPLSTLTVKFTDQYMRRSFSSMQHTLDPDSVLFLGDLFDGGREWSTPTSTSPEERWRKYKDDFWKKEFHRFVKVFLNPWSSQETQSTNSRGRRLIASLPGNHDQGFGSGVQLPVRDRFQNFFGKGNRVDIIGNHTFVSVDSVSLSSMDQPDPQTGSTGAGNGDGERPNQKIWQEPEDFLNAMKLHRGRAEMDELRFLGKPREGRLFKHEVTVPSEPTIYREDDPEIIGFPTILLSHVPLYRKPATPCGPLRERYPPSAEGLEEDEPNALKLSGGYQYQNVLTKTISNDIVSKIGPNLVHVYSGDDHDYCEITHREFSGSPKEITVKSTSWAMGVRKPGFVLTSLWNPIDPTTGASIDSQSPGSTLQNHLCLLPDQLSIFIYYGLILAFTLTVLLLRAVILALRKPEPTTPDPILPLTETPAVRTRARAVSITSSSNYQNNSSIKPGGLASRATNGNPRYTPPVSNDANGYPGFDYIEEADTSKWKASSSDRRRRGNDTLFGRVSGEFTGSVKSVARVALVWYFILVWRW
ncbi:putative manganese ion homeostasis (Fr) [Aspergillus mulundensis]|uniref:Membrane protein n=1 Tax=Aspergillus mulundensis TaxID=1810919 RepID=A0A3D8S5M6_9EURO|nr:Membrane protein [Aspergillus mulundensis]RDW81500.1 Membrane protein [Aspergillus mulundensis]